MRLRGWTAVLLVAGAAGGLVATRARDAAPGRATTRDTISIVIAGSADPALDRGLKLGAEEAARMAQLIGFHLQIREAGSAVRDTESADFVILAGSDAQLPPTASPAMYIDATSADAFACADGVLRILPSAGERVTAAAGNSNARILAWHPSLYRYGAEQLNNRFVERFGVPMDEAAWSGWFAVKLAVELGSSADASGDVGARAPGFDGHKGMRLTFDEDGRLRQPLYRLTTDANGDTTVDQLDARDVGEATASCR